MDIHEPGSMTPSPSVLPGQQIRATSQVISDAFYDLYSSFLMALMNGVGLSWNAPLGGSSVPV